MTIQLYCLLQNILFEGVKVDKVYSDAIDVDIFKYYQRHQIKKFKKQFRLYGV